MISQTIACVCMTFASIAHPQIRDFLNPFKLKNEQLCNIMNRLDEQLNRGLNAKTHADAPIKCYQTFIHDLPTGKETGRHLVLEITGLSFRIMLVTLEKELNYEKEVRTYSLPVEKTQGNADEFFDFIVQCLEFFIKENQIKTEKLGLGFCFGFPVKLESLTKGILTHWSKKFNVSGVIGQDVVALLRLSLNKKNINLHPIILINDTTGCLLSCASIDRKCRLAIIIGMGTNACYMEKTENVGLYSGDRGKPYVIINTEWNNFGNDGVLNEFRTEFDAEVDKASISPGIQIFEKMTSSMYISEIIRLVILKCAALNYLFEGETSEMLQRPMTFLPDFIYEIEGDSTPDLRRTLGVLEVMSLKNVAIQDCVNVKYICEIVCRRSANLISAGVSTIINRMAFTSVSVTFDGNLYRKHPNYKEILREKINRMKNSNIQANYTLSHDAAACQGAALVLASYQDPTQVQSVIK